MAHPKEKRQKLEETKEELTIRLKCLRLLFVQKQEKATYITELTGTKESFTIEEKFY